MLFMAVTMAKSLIFLSIRVVPVRMLKWNQQRPIFLLQRYSFALSHGDLLLCGNAAMEEVTGDLFGEDDPSTALAHCVSADLAMGKGIAKQFRDKFGGLRDLKLQDHNVGDAPYLHLSGRYVFYLVTKEKYWHKPTYSNLELALKTAKKHMDQLGIDRVAIPLLGCGLDRLKWPIVRSLIRKEWMESSKCSLSSDAAAVTRSNENESKKDVENEDLEQPESDDKGNDEDNDCKPHSVRVVVYRSGSASKKSSQEETR